MPGVDYTHFEMITDNNLDHAHYDAYCGQCWGGINEPSQTAMDDTAYLEKLEKAVDEGKADTSEDESPSSSEVSSSEEEDIIEELVDKKKANKAAIEP